MTIEYVDRAWNPMTGCRNTLAECPTADTCWARTLSHRFVQICGGDFQPRYHLSRLENPLEWHKPCRIATCFMGDLFGDWREVEAIGSLGATLDYKGWDMAEVQRQILVIVRKCPQHSFLFLTKNPSTLAQWNPWPENAWAGASAWDEASAIKAIYYLQKVQAKVKWLSLEPLLDRIMK